MQANFAINESIRKNKVFGWLSLFPWILATLFTCPFCFLSLRLLIPLFLLALIIACFSAARFAKRPRVLRAVRFLTSLMGAISLVEAAICMVHRTENWRFVVGFTAGILFFLPMLAGWLLATNRLKLFASPPQA